MSTTETSKRDKCLKWFEVRFAKEGNLRLGDFNC